MLQDLTNSWKAFSASCSCGSIFPAKSCQEKKKVVKMLEEVLVSW